MMSSLEIQIIDHFYPREAGGVLREILLQHSACVRDKALALLDSLEDGELKRSISPEVIRTGSMLHDLGIRYCHAPSIHCTGEEPYLAHGRIGGDLLRQYGRERDLDLECYARICERHTGAGLTEEEIRKNVLPLPAKDFLPETPEEKVICLADKFFSKSGKQKEKDLETVIRSMKKFGSQPNDRFEALAQEFNIRKIPVLNAD